MNSIKPHHSAARSNKTNVLMSTIIMILILILILQIWLMYGTLNKALDDNHGFAFAAFCGSLFLFITGLFLLKFLQEPTEQKTKDPNNQYE